MHPNPVFHSRDHEKDVALARERAFGTLVLNGDPLPMVSHVPFLLTEDGTSADLHLVRSNPIARAVAEPTPALLCVQGPDGYISPDWYESPDQVPTWNYVAVRLSGLLRPLPADELHALLDRQSAHYETRLVPKTPWTTAKMTPDVLERMMRMILPFRFEVAAIDATWKLGQNKPDAARKAAARDLRRSGIGSDTAALADLMRNPPDL